GGYPFIFVDFVVVCLGAGLLCFGHTWPPKQICADNGSYQQTFHRDGEMYHRKDTERKGSRESSLGHRRIGSSARSILWRNCQMAPSTALSLRSIEQSLWGM